MTCARPRAAITAVLLAVDSQSSRRLAGTFTRALCTTTVIALASGAAPFSSASAQRVLTVVAHDTGLTVSPTVPAGLITVRLLLQGKVRRELIVHRIPSGTSPEALARGAAGRPEAWFQKWSFGGPAVPRDSAPDASTTVEFRPGRYVLVSYEVDAAGRARGDRYFWSWVTAVAASELIPGRFSVPDATIRLRDGRIDVAGSLRTGQRTLQIDNAGSRPHDLRILRLKAGKTIDDVRRWDQLGDAPFVYIGGVTPMSTGMTAQTRLVLQSGTHVVVCGMRHGGARDGDYARAVMATFKVS